MTGIYLRDLPYVRAMALSKDTPLAEVTLRRYEKPYEMSRRELIKKLCLSVGLLQPGDSRDIIVDVLYVLLEAKRKKQALPAETVQAEVIALRKQKKLPLKGIAPSNLRRQLKRLRDLFLVEKVKNQYRIAEFEDLDVLFEEKIERFYLDSILSRIKEYLRALE